MLLRLRGYTTEGTDAIIIKKRLAITEREDFEKLALMLITFCNMRGNYMYNLSAGAIAKIELRDDQQVNPRNDPFTIELKLDSEVGS